MGPTAGLETWKIYLFIFLLLPKIEPQIFCLPVRSQVTILITAPPTPPNYLCMWVQLGSAARDCRVPQLEFY